MESTSGGTLSRVDIAHSSSPFKLDSLFVASYAARRPKFGLVSGPNTVGELTFMRTYARRKADGTLERWHEVCERVVNGTYRMQQRHIEHNVLGWDPEHAQRSAQEMYDRMWNMKFLPPGRGLWIMGTDFIEQRRVHGALQNPLHVDTKVLTKEHGWIAIGDIDTDKVTVLTNTKLYGRDDSKPGVASAKWVEADVTPVQEHPCLRITYASKEGDSYTVVASENHRWACRKSSSVKRPWTTVTTVDLRVGDYLPRTRPAKNFHLSPFGAQHGFFFGDGSRVNGLLDLFDANKIEAAKDIYGQHAVWPYHDENGSLVAGRYIVRNCPLAWGQVPAGSYAEDQKYVYGFLAGYFAADGSLSDTGTPSISSARHDELMSVKGLFERLGVRTGEIRLSSTSSNFKEERELWQLSISLIDLDEQFFLRPSHKAIFARRLVEDRIQNDWLRITLIEKLPDVYPVRCVTVPEYEQFVIEGFCLTRNCGFVSTEDIDKDSSEPFCWLMDASMLGVGVGFDNAGAGKLKIHSPRPPAAKPVSVDSAMTDGQVYPIYKQEDNSDYLVITISDDREGWVDSLRQLLDSYFTENHLPVLFNYHLVRRAGLPIKGFGGTSSGPWPLWSLHRQVTDVLDKGAGKPITVRIITDVMNMIGACVVAGNVRRSAEISFGEWDSDEFINLKNTSDGIAPEYLARYTERLAQLKRQKNYDPSIECFADLGIPEKQLVQAVDKVHRLYTHGWCSNNSILARVGMDYGPIAERIRVNGEPGLVWLENMRKFSRMCDPPDNKDHRVKGANPCSEQSLENMECCTLVETFIHRHTDKEDYLRTLKFAYLYAKTVTLGATHWAKTNKVMARNRRIGCSMTGVAQFVETRGLATLTDWCNDGYREIEKWDVVYSEWMGIPLSRKKTSVKPSGTVSKVVGASPGAHFPIEVYSIIRIRFGNDDPILAELRACGYTVEPAVGQEKTTSVVEFPTYLGDDIRTESEVSIWEQVNLACHLQAYWADNQVSFTGKFDPEKEGHMLANILSMCETRLKGVSFLPKTEEGAFAQMPNEAITKQRYHELIKNLQPVDFDRLYDSGKLKDGIGERFCSTDKCELVLPN